MTDESKTYNGWSNYETWVIKLWMDNEEGSQRYWSDQAQHVWDMSEALSYCTRDHNAAWKLADQLKEEHEEAAPETEGVFADLMNAALGEVDWREIAYSLLEEVEKEEEETDGSTVDNAG